MMAEIDLSDLSDDQLVELARAVAIEIARRDPAVDAAARSAVLDEAEKLRVAQRAAEAEAARLRARERERIAEQAAAKVRREAAARDADSDPHGWRVNKALARMVVDQLGSGWSCTVWSRQDERRVYLDRYPAKVSYYVTGDFRHPPGQLKTEAIGRSINRVALKAAVAFAGKSWRSHQQFDIDAALMAEVPMAPLPPDYLAAIAGVAA